MKCTIFAFGLMCGWSILALGEPPPERPEMSDVDAPAPRRWGGAGRPDAPTAEEWEKVSAFMQEQSPHRWRLYQRLAEESSAQRSVRRMIWSRYQNLQDLKQEDPAFYEMRLRQLQLEDEIFDLVDLLKNAESPEQKDKVRGQMREKLGQAVDIGIKERRHRINKLEKALQTEKNRLAADEKDHEKLIENRLNRLLSPPDQPGSAGGQQERSN